MGCALAPCVCVGGADTVEPREGYLWLGCVCGLREWRRCVLVAYIRPNNRDNGGGPPPCGRRRARSGRLHVFAVRVLVRGRRPAAHAAQSERHTVQWAAPGAALVLAIGAAQAAGTCAVAVRASWLRYGAAQANTARPYRSLTLRTTVIGGLRGCHTELARAMGNCS